MNPTWSVRIRGSVMVVLCLLAVGCGKADFGEPCDEAGQEDECVDGAICTNEGGEDFKCRALCDKQEDCPDGFECNGVSSTNLKSCQPES